MPQIRVRGIEINILKKISKLLIDDLEDIIKCPRDYFTLEHVPSTFIFDSYETEGYPFVDVYWFDRGQEIQDKVAKSITDILQSEGIKDMDIIFHSLEHNKYYENGEHF